MSLICLLTPLPLVALKNLEIARLYLGSKLLSIAVIEALSQRLGQDIPLATMMGELPGRGLSTAQLENFLPTVAHPVMPTTPLEQEVLELLEKGRSKSSSYDVKTLPLPLTSSNRWAFLNHSGYLIR